MDKKELDIDFNKWESTLTYRQRKLANTQCDEKYGCTVPELYEKLRAQLDSKDDLLVAEAFELPNNDKIVDISNWPVEQKIAYSNYIMKTEHDVIIIAFDDKAFHDKEEYDAIDALYQKFQSEITTDRRTLSDNYSLAIWGKTVTDMYKYVVSIKETDQNKIHQLFRESIIDKTLSQTIDIYKDSDALHKEMMKIDAFTNSESFYESSVLEESIGKIENEDEAFNYYKELPPIVPFLTFDEYCEYNEDCNTTAHSYVFIENGRDYYLTLKELQAKDDEQAQLKLGWNPAIPINVDTVEKARIRQAEWMNERYSNLQIIDISDMDVQLEDSILEANDNTILDASFMLKPVYIVLSFANTVFGNVINKFKHSEYSHAGISFDSSLDNIYTYNFQPGKINGFTKESIKDYHNAKDKNGDVKLMVNTIFVPHDAWAKMKETLKFYENNKDKSRYGFENLINFVTNKAKDSANSIYMVCSQFVDNLLKAANIDLTNKSSNLVAPADFEKPKEGSKVFVLFKGWKKDYEKKEIDKKVKALEKANSYKVLNVMENAELVEYLFSCHLENFFTCDSIDPIVHESLTKIRTILTPTPAIVVNEFKLPVRFSANGDLNIDLPANLQAEYEESHKLLSMYDESNMNGIKHEVARMFYLNSIIEKKLQRMKKTDKNFKTLMDLRARILNDYTTYFKVIKSAEPDFDFLSYIKSTEYWNKTVVIDGHTLKYSGAYIKKAIDLLK